MSTYTWRISYLNPYQQHLRTTPSTSKTKGKKRHSAKITNIATWTECFATYTSIVSMRNPARTQDLLAYTSLIAHASRQYKGDEWLSYDAVFRQQAADHPEWKWASVNTSLWTTAFCHAVPRDHCSTCFSLEHTSDKCPDSDIVKDNYKEKQQPLKSEDSHSTTTAPRPICINYNYRSCTSPICTYRHICPECHGNHRCTRCTLSSNRYRPYSTNSRQVPVHPEDRYLLGMQWDLSLIHI